MQINMENLFKILLKMKKNPVEFLIEQQAKISEQQAKSNEQ